VIPNDATGCTSTTASVRGLGGRDHGVARSRGPIAAGETVVEVPPTLAARARLLRTGHGRKTDGIDALSVAEIAAARQDLRDVVADGDTAMLRLLADRRDELSQQRRRRSTGSTATCVISCPGGAPTSLTADIASKALSRLRPTDAVTIERKHVARQLVAEIRRIDADLEDNRQRTRDIVDASGTSLLDTFGISHVLAARSSVTPAPSAASRAPTPTPATAALPPRERQARADDLRRGPWEAVARRPPRRP